jgi:CRISPR-associated protein Csb2
MRRDHGHAYYLPTAEGDDPRRITHVTMLAADGFGVGDSGEVAALSGLRRLTGLGDGDGLRVQLVGLGEPADFTHRLFRRDRVWTSATPFVGPAHLGRRVRDRDVRKAVRRELRRRVADGRLAIEPTLIEVVPAGRCPIPGLRFRRSRTGHPDGDRPGAFVRLTFAEPVAGPLSLGYASHFGLGLFLPADTAGAPR